MLVNNKLTYYLYFMLRDWPTLPPVLATEPYSSSRHGSFFSLLNNHLVVDVDFRTKNVDLLIGNPYTFYDCLTSGLLEKADISVEIPYAGFAKVEVKSSGFFAKFKIQYKIQYGASRNICLEEVEIANKRNGIGKIFFNNLIKLADDWNVSKISLRAGRCDGEFFWLRRYGKLDNVVSVKAKFADAVYQNAKNLILPDEVLSQLSSIIERGEDTMGSEIAYIDFGIDERPVGIPLLKNTNPQLFFYLDQRTDRQRILSSLCC